MSPDRNRALALLIVLLVLALGCAFAAYRWWRPPSAATPPAATTKRKPKPPPPDWRPQPVFVAPDPSQPPTRPQLVPDSESRPGALLPLHRIVAFYGHPKSTRMGILGQLPPAEMLPKLASTALAWAQADPGRKVLPALHVVVTVAQDQPGPDGLYRMRHPHQLIEDVIGWAAPRGWIVFLDVQLGHSRLADELPRLRQHLARPDVHLALDPEFAMPPGVVPGHRVGSLDAADINHALQFLAGLVEDLNLPPKLLVVHRFSQGMLTNYQRIRLDPRVQLVLNMDGYGTPLIKESAYRSFVAAEAVQFTGFKLFYQKDHPLMTPDQVLGLFPEPVYIQYQ